MKLGICCVYFYGSDNGWLLDLQLRYIAGTLAGYDYTVYAAANRLLPDLRRTLDATPHVRIVSLPQYEGDAVAEPWMEASFEHAFYLDLLLREAADDGCTHLAAVDSDSFPVLPDWPNVLLKRMGSIRFAGVLRSENLDTNLPHPSGLFMDRSFLLEHAPRLLPPRNEILSNASLREFMKETAQRADTGIGFGHALWKSREPWLPLLRSNQRNRHFLMAGIYGDVFFHLGASSRRPWFHFDYQKRLSLRMKPALSKIPMLWHLGSWLEERYIASNERTLAKITDSLRSDPDRFLSSLQGS
ncbi:MAG TPA: hypothetical protein VHY36_06970 [Steroidobacteraceae bacterium]|jgi:hypothetical protein|nr:hypothetical protein [Steroidobacteraceae bacterium]